MLEIITQGAAFADTIKKALELSRKANNVELQTALMDLREYVQELRERVVNLQAENAAFREKTKLKEDMQWDGRFFWVTLADGVRSGPYCPRCYGDKEKAVPLIHHDIDLAMYGRTLYHQCPVCDFRLDD